MMVILFATLFGWLWILHKSIEAQFLLRIFTDQCSSPNFTCLYINWLSKFHSRIFVVVVTNLIFLGWFRPNNVRFASCDNIPEKCEYANRAYPRFQTVATCSILVVLSLIHFLVSMALHCAFVGSQGTDNPTVRSQSSTIVSSQSSTHSRDRIEREYSR